MTRVNPISHIQNPTHVNLKQIAREYPPQNYELPESQPKIYEVNSKEVKSALQIGGPSPYRVNQDILLAQLQKRNQTSMVDLDIERMRIESQQQNQSFKHKINQMKLQAQKIK